LKRSIEVDFKGCSLTDCYFQGKIVLITGAGSGLGRSLSLLLAQKGAVTIVTDIDEQKGLSVRNEIRSAGFSADAKVLDVSDFSAFNQMIKQVISEYSTLDILINNAGYLINAEVQNVTTESYKKLFDVNVLGTISGSKIAYIQMLKQEKGQIVNISSMFGLFPSPTAAAYVASKYAVVGFTRSLRHEAKSSGIKVSVVCPGFIDTSFFNNAEYPAVDKSKMLAQLPDNMITADAAAKRVLKGVIANKEIIFFPWYVGVLYWLDRFAPFVLNFLHKRTVQQYRNL
jgi:short-subunit dehydrogenase